jgi:hypothetical protein
MTISRGEAVWRDGKPTGKRARSFPPASVSEPPPAGSRAGATPGAAYAVQHDGRCGRGGDTAEDNVFSAAVLDEPA